MWPCTQNINATHAIFYGKHALLLMNGRKLIKLNLMKYKQVEIHFKYFAPVGRNVWELFYVCVHESLLLSKLFSKETYYSKPI